MDENQRAGHLLNIRQSFLTLLANEGNGVWQRFNFFMVVETALLAGNIVLLKDNANGPSFWGVELLGLICVAISFFGFYFTIIAMRALDRHWTWHGCYVEMVRRTESELPNEIPKYFVVVKDEKLVDKAMPRRPEMPFRLTPLCHVFAPMFGKLYFDKEERNWFTGRPTHQFFSLVPLLWLILGVFAIVVISVEMAAETVAH